MRTRSDAEVHDLALARPHPNFLRSTRQPRGAIPLVPVASSDRDHEERLPVSPGTIDGFVSLDELTRMLDLHPNGMRRRLQTAGVEVFSDPFDRRRRLIRREDLPKITEPLPVRGKPAGRTCRAAAEPPAS